MSIKGEEIIRQSAELRGNYKFDEAINLIEQNISAIHPDIKVIALIEVFRAAQEKGDNELATQYAKLIFIEEPELPSIQGYL